MTAELTARVPPNAPEAELAVLGSVLLEPDTLADALADVTPLMFYREGHRTIFAVMQDLAAQGAPPDLSILVTELTRRGQLDEVGGVVYLAGLADQVGTSAYAEHYGRQVREHWMLRELIRESSSLIRDAYDGTKPLEDLLTAAGQIGQQLDIQSEAGNYAIRDVVGTLRHQLATGTGERPLSTGLVDLDTQLGGGLRRSSLNVLAARPSMGKSALALNVAENVARQLHQTEDDGQLVVVSLEMPKEQLVARVLSSASRIESTRLGDALLGKVILREGEQKRFDHAANELEPLPIMFRDDAVSDAQLHQLGRNLRRLHRVSPLRLVVVDYLQLMTASRAGDNRVLEVSIISRTLKQLAREFECPFLVLSQLSRAVEQRPNHRPMLSDLRESGAVEQDADVVMFIYRDEYYNKETDQQGIAEIIVGKQRNGAVGTVKLQFMNVFARFADLAHHS